MQKDPELERILAGRHLTALFQPIVACREAAVFGYEALIRGPSDSPLHSPINLFDAAGRSNRLAELDLMARQVAMTAFGERRLPGRLFLNVTPAALTESSFRAGETLRYLNTVGLAPERVVIELTEQYPVNDYAIMRTAVDHYRSMGFSIALDDLGAGYSSLRHWSELRPDYVKIDRHFVQGIDQDPAKRQFIRSILEISANLGCQVIAEGIETLEEYRNLWSMGLTLGQGYYFARPQANPPRAVSNLLPGGGEPALRVGFGETVSSLLSPVPPVEPSLAAEDVAQVFHASPALRTLAIVSDGKPLGLIRRQRLMGLFAGQYGRALYGKRPIIELAERDIVVAEHDLPVERLSQRITDSPNLSGDEDFVVLDHAGRYAGIGNVIGLLRKITELQVRNARYANPLTGLPGNVPINERMEELLRGGTPFAAAYCDLDNFKAFNDHYGYSRGDDVIISLSRLLKEHIDPRHDFLGHIGGDDFMVLFVSEDWRERCEALLEAFGAQAPWFYEPPHRQAGGIDSLDRQGRPSFFPIMSISVALVPVQPGQFHTRHEIATLVSEVKEQAKRIPGNSLFVDRRGRVEAVPRVQAGAMAG